MEQNFHYDGLGLEIRKAIKNSTNSLTHTNKLWHFFHFDSSHLSFVAFLFALLHSLIRSSVCVCVPVHSFYMLSFLLCPFHCVAFGITVYFNYYASTPGMFITLRNHYHLPYTFISWLLFSSSSSSSSSSLPFCTLECYTCSHEYVLAACITV